MHDDMSNRPLDQVDVQRVCRGRASANDPVHFNVRVSMRPHLHPDPLSGLDLNRWLTTLARDAGPNRLNDRLATVLDIDCELSAPWKRRDEKVSV